MGALQPMHLLLVLVIVLIVFGAGRLPEAFSQVGKGVREFRSHAEAPTHSSDASARFCAQCGAPLSADAKFCDKCGAKTAAI
jgi:TatA/E family protein of Tat protein translocase